MKKTIGSIVAGVILSLIGFITIASAQVYGPISWYPTQSYQPYGFTIAGGYNYGSYWSPNLGNQPQGICVTCSGWSASSLGWNSGINSWNAPSIPSGYYPNGYRYQIRDAQVIRSSDNKWSNNHIQTYIFRPF